MTWLTITMAPMKLGDLGTCQHVWECCTASRETKRLNATSECVPQPVVILIHLAPRIGPTNAAPSNVPIPIRFEREMDFSVAKYPITSLGYPHKILQSERVEQSGMQMMFCFGHGREMNATAPAVVAPQAEVADALACLAAEAEMLKLEMAARFLNSALSILRAAGAPPFGQEEQGYPSAFQPSLPLAVAGCPTLPSLLHRQQTD